MAAMLISRRIKFTNKLINPSSSSSSSFLLQNPNNPFSLTSPSHSFSTFSKPKPSKNPILNLSQFLFSPKQNLINLPKYFSTNPTSPISQTLKKSPNPNFEQKPQNPDLKPDETPSSIFEELIAPVQVASMTVTFLGLVHLSLGTWIYITTKVSPMSEIFVQAVISTSFASTLASLLRQLMMKLREMERQGQLQNLTTNLQVVKIFRIFILSISGIALFKILLAMVSLSAITVFKYM